MHLKEQHSKLVCAVDFDTMFTDLKSLHDSTYKSAKYIVEIIAHANVIQELTGDKQLGEARSLLSKPRQVPAILTAEVKAVVDAAERKVTKKRKGPPGAK